MQMDIVRNDVDSLIGIHTQMEMEDTDVNTIYGKISEGKTFALTRLKLFYKKDCGLYC